MFQLAAPQACWGQFRGCHDCTTFWVLRFYGNLQKRTALCSCAVAALNSQFTLPRIIAHEQWGGRHASRFASFLNPQYLIWPDPFLVAKGAGHQTMIIICLQPLPYTVHATSLRIQKLTYLPELGFSNSPYVNSLARVTVSNVWRWA